MHAPPRLALLAALGLIALFPSLPISGSVEAGDQQQGELFALNIQVHSPAAHQGLELDIAMVPPGGPWVAPLTAYHHEQTLLLTSVTSSCDVILRSRDGLWEAREALDKHPSGEPLRMRLEPRGILSGVVLDSDNKPMNCLVQAQGQDGALFTVGTSDDGTFRFAWLPEGKYHLISPLSVHGRCRTDAIAIAGQEIHLRLQPRPTEGPPAEIIGHVQSRSGEYREELRVRLWPLDADAAPSEADVVWQQNDDQVISGSFVIPATQGEEYVLRVEKSDLHPTAYRHAPISAPDGVEIFCDDSSPHTDLIVRPVHEGDVEGVQEFEVALSWGHEVVWRNSQSGECRINGVPTDRPVAWMVRAPNTAPAFGELTVAEPRPQHVLNPRLNSGWGEGLRLVLPDGAPAANVLVHLDDEPAGRTDMRGLLTLQRSQPPTHLSLQSDHVRLFGGAGSTRPLTSLTDRDEFGRLLLVLLPRD